MLALTSTLAEPCQEEMVSWVEPTDLERDLHLAAELGKSLLEKNQELEEAFHQLDQTNQDQAQEIQFLNQQLVASRESRNHQVCLYEQLQTTTQDLEAANHSLRKESHSAQLRVTSLQKLVDSLQTEVDELQQRLKMSRYPSPSNNEDKCNSLQKKHSLEASILTKCIANNFPGTSVVNEPQSQPPWSPQDVMPVYYTPPLTGFKKPQATMDPICPAERLQAAKLEGNLNAACVTISALKARVVELEPWVSHAAELQAALIAERNCSDMITRGSFYPVREDECNGAGLWNSNDCVMEPMVHGDWVEGGVQNEFGGAGCWVHLGGWHRIVRPEAAALTQLDHAPSASLSNEIQEAIDKAVQETFPNENGTPHFTSLHRSHPAKGMDSNSAFPSASTAPVKGVALYKSMSTKPEPEYKALFKEIFHRIGNVKEDCS